MRPRASRSASRSTLQSWQTGQPRLETLASPATYQRHRCSTPTEMPMRFELPGFAGGEVPGFCGGVLGLNVEGVLFGEVGVLRRGEAEVRIVEVFEMRLPLGRAAGFLENGFEILSGSGTVARHAANPAGGNPSTGIAFNPLDPAKQRILARVVELNSEP